MEVLSIARLFPSDRFELILSVVANRGDPNQLITECELARWWLSEIAAGRTREWDFWDVKGLDVGVRVTVNLSKVNQLRNLREVYICAC